MKISSSGNNFILKLEPGDEIITELENFYNAHPGKTYFLTGIGALKQASLACFDLDKKSYLKHDFRGSYEIISLIGNITTIDNKPVIHSHINLSDRKFQLIAGHLVKGIISITAEIFITTVNLKIARQQDNRFNLNLLNI